LCKFPKPLYIQKFKFYSEIVFPPIPAHSAQPRPLHPQAVVRALGPLGPLSLSSLAVFAKTRLFFEFAQSVNDVSYLTLLPSGPHPSNPAPSSRRLTRSKSPPRLAVIDRPAPLGLHH
jgi:hypothetical protein